MDKVTFTPQASTDGTLIAAIVAPDFRTAHTTPARTAFGRFWSACQNARCGEKSPWPGLELHKNGDVTAPSRLALHIQRTLTYLDGQPPGLHPDPAGTVDLQDRVPNCHTIALPSDHPLHDVFRQMRKNDDALAAAGTPQVRDGCRASLTLSGKYVGGSCTNVMRTLLKTKSGRVRDLAMNGRRAEREEMAASSALTSLREALASGCRASLTLDGTFIGGRCVDVSRKLDGAGRFSAGVVRDLNVNGRRVSTDPVSRQAASSFLGRACYPEQLLRE